MTTGLRATGLTSSAGSLGLHFVLGAAPEKHDGNDARNAEDDGNGPHQHVHRCGPAQHAPFA